VVEDLFLSNIMSTKLVYLSSTFSIKAQISVVKPRQIDINEKRSASEVDESEGERIEVDLSVKHQAKLDSEGPGVLTKGERYKVSYVLSFP
jgi:hypothetical protein